MSTHSEEKSAITKADEHSPPRHKEHAEGRQHAYDLDSSSEGRLNAVFENPLSDIPREQLIRDVQEFCQKFDLTDSFEVMKKGALISQSPHGYRDIPELTEEDKNAIAREKSHKWNQPWQLYWLCVMASLAAATQGMDETANNGAQAIYTRYLGITAERLGSQQHADYILGLVVGAPYLACAVLGCWLTEPMNKIFARRGTIFISCVIAAAASIWEAFCNDWGNLFAARFVLGLGIGAKSSTVPVYTAECAPAPIRGALVMQWQVWTAFGIMLGNIMGVAFGGLGDNLSWRLMLGSTVVLPLFVCAQVYFCPESPRWLIQNGKVPQAYKAFKTLRSTELQAARDLYYTYVGVELEKKVNKGKNLFTQFFELFSVSRNRRATWATWIVMFGQQFCGVNVIAYYSTNVFIEGGFSTSQALLVSMGTGILNWVFALPAFFTIDTFGRRPLLLFTYPFLCIFLLWTGLSFLIDPPAEEGGVSLSTRRTAMITTGMYLYECFYSPGMGPVPFSYSAEAFPIQVRDVGMSWATATTWCFNFILSFTWPSLVTAFKPEGAFGFYAAWCLILWILVLLFMPETKQLTLEELDQVFSVPTWKHSSYQIKNSIWHIRKYVLRQKNLEPLPPFYIGAERLNGDKRSESSGRSLQGTKSE